MAVHSKFILSLKPAIVTMPSWDEAAIPMIFEKRTIKLHVRFMNGVSGNIKVAL